MAKRKANKVMWVGQNYLGKLLKTELIKEKLARNVSAFIYMGHKIFLLCIKC